MIYGELKDLKFYKGISERFDKAIDCILSGDYKKGTPGKNVIDGDDVYFNFDLSETVEEEKRFFEGHQKYIDIHIMIEGEEKIGYTTRNNVIRLGSYDRMKDFEKYDGSPDNFFLLNEDTFVVFFPEEPHMALVKVDEPMSIKKAVFKIRL